LSFEKHIGKTLTWPLSEHTLTNFIFYAVTVKNLKHSTIKTYISSFALYQNLRKIDSKNCFSFHTKTALKGAKNLEFYKVKKTTKRRAVTYPMLKILCHQIANTAWPKHNKQVFWTALTVAFFGAMRFGELLSSSSNVFNSHETLLWEDINLKHSSAIVTVKIPKSKNLKSEFVDLFKIPDERYCPINALKVLKESTKNFSEKIPVFTFENGLHLTIHTLNSTLHTLLFPLLGDIAYEYSAHSFRAGLPSALASCPDLVADEQVKLCGRWSSDSFKSYTRLKTSQKKFLFDKIVLALERQ
jgi:hypothetical protein